MFVRIRGNKLHAEGVEDFGNAPLPEARSIPRSCLMNVLFCNQSLQSRVYVRWSKSLSNAGELFDLCEEALDF
jgi:hypothetical protein